jgi:hypothetical protein
MGQAPDNLGTTRKLALPVLNQMDDSESLENQRKRAGLDGCFFGRIIALFKGVYPISLTKFLLTTRALCIDLLPLFVTQMSNHVVKLS